MQRERFLTHIGFEGHYSLSVQFKPNLVNESIKVEEPALDSGGHHDLATFTHVTQKDFEQMDYVQDPSSAGKEQYHHALESVLKLGVIENAESCIREHSNDEFVDLSKQIRSLKQKIRKNKFENTKMNRSMMYHVSHKATVASEKQSELQPKKPGTPAMYRESPRKRMSKASDPKVEFDSTMDSLTNSEETVTVQSSHTTLQEEDCLQVSAGVDENKSTDTKETIDLRKKREEIKSIARKLNELTKMNNNVPDVNNEVAIKLLEKGHPNLEKLMKDLLKARLNKLSDETRWVEWIYRILCYSMS
jgi:hypothetical protein